MKIIFESNGFTVQAPAKPLVDRDDGGHIVIDPKIRVVDRQHLTTAQAIELMRLTIVAGQAMTVVMTRNGVDIGRINYQDNGNWAVFLPEGPFLHVHLYGRAKSAKRQKYGQACYFPHRDEVPEFYEKLQPLNAKDIADLGVEMTRLLGLEEFSDAEWGLQPHPRS